MKEAAQRIRQRRKEIRDDVVNELRSSLRALREADLEDLLEDSAKERIYKAAKRITQSVERDGFNERVWLQAKIPECTYRRLAKTSREWQELLEYELDSNVPRWAILDAMINTMIDLWESTGSTVQVQDLLCRNAHTTRMGMLRSKGAVSEDG